MRYIRCVGEVRSSFFQGRVGNNNTYDNNNNNINKQR